MSNTNPRDELDQAFIDTLLMEVYRRDDGQEEARIQRLLASTSFAKPSQDSVEAPRLIEAEESSIKPLAAATFRKTPSWVRRTIPYVLAASLLIACSIWFVMATPANQAIAAVTRAIAVNPPTREYAVQISVRTPKDKLREISGTLYLDDRDRFVVRHVGILGLGETWIGGNPTQRWIVPPVGPIAVGGEAMIGKLLARKEVETPYLHLTTILQRMRKGYELDLRADESIEPKPMGTSNGETSSKPILCTRVHGKLLVPSERFPESIDLWANKETGMAEKLELRWFRRKTDLQGETNDHSATPMRTWVIQLTGTPTLPKDWFEFQGHANANRRVIQLGSESDLNEWKP